MNLLSIQSHVAYGHVGNAAAVFTLQRIGIEVWPIHTVQLSNHTGYAGWRGQVFDAEAIREVALGIEERGVFATCDGVLSGYLGSAAVGAAVLDTVARVRAANPHVRYCCDPVIGDTGRGVYVRDDVAALIRERALPAADVLTPNHFELEFLSGREVRTQADALAAIATLRALGPRAVLVTSVVTRETPADCLDVIACDDTGAWRVRTPRLPIAANGAGDAMAALFFAHWLRSGSAAHALSLSVSAVFGVLARTAAAGARELLLVEAQEELVQPGRMFAVEHIGDGDSPAA